MNRISKVFGVGLNDSQVPVSTRGKRQTRNGKVYQETLWVCPYYSKWKDMLMRCYSYKYLQAHPSYQGCYVCDEWFVFSNFKSWMEKQDWEGNQLDKDILVPGNKKYSPETCVFISPQLNIFLAYDRNGDLLPGVTFNRRANKFCSQISISGKVIGLGYHDTECSAHKAWFHAKVEHAKVLISSESDSRITLEVVIDRLNHAKYTRKQKHKKEG